MDLDLASFCETIKVALANKIENTVVEDRRVKFKGHRDICPIGVWSILGKFQREEDVDLWSVPMDSFLQ